MFIKIEIIYTFKNKQQEIEIISVNNNITQKSFIKKILRSLSKNECKNLIKISTLQFANRKTKIQWLFEEPKYYFNDGYWNKFLKDFIKK